MTVEHNFWSSQPKSINDPSKFKFVFLWTSKEKELILWKFIELEKIHFKECNLFLGHLVYNYDQLVLPPPLKTKNFSLKIPFLSKMLLYQSEENIFYTSLGIFFSGMDSTGISTKATTDTGKDSLCFIWNYNPW